MNLGIIICWYIGTLVLEALTYGAAGYLVFKLLKGKEKDWFIGAFLTFIAFLLWNVYFANSIFKAIGITITNKAVINFLGRDAAHLFETDFSDILVAFIQILCGFKIVQVAFKKMMNKKQS